MSASSSLAGVCTLISMFRSSSSMAKGGKQYRQPNRKGSPSILPIALLTVFFSVIFIFGIVSLPTPSTFSSAKSHSVVHSSSGPRNDEWVEFVSWEPRAFIYHNFLSKEECEYLIMVAKPHMRNSTVVDSVTGKSIDSEVRTSSGAFLRRGQDEVITAIEKRIAEWTHIPADHGEGLHVIHYQVGQKYSPHLDYFSDSINTENGGQRMATVLMYLSDVEEGGETVFPNAMGNHSEVPYWDSLSECGKEGLSVKPKMGDALLFWSMKPDASLDPLSLHGACPVIRGNKWSCTKWMRVDQYSV